VVQLPVNQGSTTVLDGKLRPQERAISDTRMRGKANV